MDFEADNLSAVPTPEYRAKIERVENILSGLGRRPHLLSFSECCSSDFLIQRATIWAKNWDVVTICGSHFNPTTSRIESVIVHRGGTAIAEKQRLSPLDQQNCSADIHQGASPGITFTLPVEGLNGIYHDVGVGVMICYDFRFQYQNPVFADWGKIQFLVIPMWDRKVAEVQSKASELAKRYFTRCLLSNKASPEHRDWAQRFPKVAKALGYLPFSEKLIQTQLPSSGHGLMTDLDLRILARFGADKRQYRLWERREEGLLIGDYELGLPITPGHDNAYGMSYNYDNFEWFSFG